MAKRKHARDVSKSPRTNAEIAVRQAAEEMAKQLAKLHEIERALRDKAGEATDSDDPLLTLKEIFRHVSLTGEHSYWRHRHLLPAPTIPAAGNRPARWRWSIVRPILVEHWPAIEIPARPIV